MKILIGTGNVAKFNFYKPILTSFKDIEVLSLNDIRLVDVPKIEETGETAEENAQLKAKEYTKFTGLPSLSIDEALYIDALPEAEQPKTKVRRFCSDIPLSDDEMIAKFLEKTKHLSEEERKITWIFGICLALPDGNYFVESVEIKEILVDKPTLPILEGYPLSSLIYNPQIKKMRKDFTQIDQNLFNQPIYDKIKLILDMVYKDGFIDNTWT